MAWALYDRGLLQEYWSGVPVLSEGERPPRYLPGRYADRLRVVGVPRDVRHHPVAFPGLLRAGSLVPGVASSGDYAHRVFHWYDWWASRHVRRLNPDAVVAYENAASRTFRAAKAVGARCILDAPSVHRLTQSRTTPSRPSRFMREINRRKEEEVAMADLVVTCSPMAAETYVEAGVPAAKVRSVLLGAEQRCGVEHTPPSERRLGEPLRFIFAGGIRHLKGIDLMLGAFRRLHAADVPCQLHLVGNLAEPGWARSIELTPNAVHHAHVAQSRLYDMMADADCLLLPSRFDAFGMVVAEGMACGTPAIVSSRVGAKAIMEQFPGSGWIIDCSEDSLYECLEDRIRDPESLLAARTHALDASKRFTWSAYRRRVSNLIEGFLA